jgi:HEAT repeat protein
MKKAFPLVVLGLLAFPAISAWTASDLERMATKDVIPEIRLAAGYALVNYYAATKSEADLLKLAESGATEAVRLAASLALSQKWVGAGKTRDELLSILTEGKTPEVRAAAVPAFMEAIVTDKADALLELAKTGATEELQYAAGKAYLQKIRAQLNKATLESICGDEALPAGYRKAAAEVLAGYYLFPATTALSKAQLEEKALKDVNPFVRYAAAYALVNFLAEESADALYKKLVSLFLAPGVSAEYRWAYARALGLKWAAGL